MAFSHLLLAFWQLGSATMLLWGLAAALPILIHLWSRHRSRPERWAAMTFLLSALRKDARRIRLEQWLLLAVRAGILLLFAVALADPRGVAPGESSGTLERGPRHTVILLDASYSMDYRVSGKSRFDNAKEMARQLVSDGNEGDSYTLIALAEPPRVVIAEPAFDKGDILQELDALRLAHSGANLAATMAEVESILRRVADRQPPVARQRVRIFTDLQLTTWGTVNSANVRARLRRLDNLAALEIVDLGQPGEQNLVVADLNVDQPLVTAHSDVQISADVQNYGGDDRSRQSLSFFVNGQRVAEERVDVPAGGRVTVAITHRFDTPGAALVEVRFSDDALPIDNRRWLSVPVRSAIRVLCVGGQPGATRHLALALAPHKLPGGALQIVEAPESRLMEEDLARFDGLFLCNIGRLSKDEAVMVSRFVHRGGGLVVFLGDQIQSESYNNLLVDAAETSLLPARLHDTVRVESNRIDPLDYRHPIVAPFRDFEQAGLLTTPLWRYIRLTPVAGAQVVAAAANGDPLIVSGRAGGGWCILVATAASLQSVDRTNESPTPWTALPLWPSFPPLVHEMLRFSLRGHGVGCNVLLGEELTGVSDPTSPEQSVIVSGPEGWEGRLPLNDDDGDLRWRFVGDRMGPYEIRDARIAQWFAVNLDPRESDLTRLDPELLPSQLGRSPLDMTDEKPAHVAFAGVSYFRWLLGAVWALLVVEPFLAWHLRRSFG